MPYLTCPDCGFTIAAAAARADDCPRCRVRQGVSVSLRPARVLSRPERDLEKATWAKSRLRGRVPGARSA